MTPLPAMPPMTALRLAPLGDAAKIRHRRERLAAIGSPLVDWLVDAALPRWSSTGVDRVRGGFFERIDLSGVAIEAPRRARVVARQVYVFATGAKNGWLPGAEALVDHGLAFLFERMQTPAGTIAASVSLDDPTRGDPSFDLYEHAFVLFAMAAAFNDSPRRHTLRPAAEALLDRMRHGWRHPVAGFEEAFPRRLPLRSNPHMHLLEAALAWASVTDGDARSRWTALVDEIVALCLDRFIDGNGAVREYFDGDWRPMPGAEGRLVEPGHQFEWAWLLMRSACLGDATRRLAAAQRLLEIGEAHGVDPSRGVAVNELDDAFRITDPAAKLWPQTERVKAWHLAAANAEDDGTAAASEAALQRAVLGLQRYVVTSPSGLWREQMDAAGRFDVPECRASSLYHIVCAIDAVCGAADEVAR